jgi:oxygen-dependent protoporphyrinogen oxidase
MTPRRVVIAGAGITGLTLAYDLRRRARERGEAIQVTALESDATVGGHVHTLREDGFVVEAGPNGFLDREPAVMALVRALGLTSRLIDATAESGRRFIVRRGVLCQVPQSPGTLLRTRALSPKGRLRLMLEPLAPGPPPGVEETVFEFARRRIGLEAAEALVDTAVSGISAGDSRALSVRAQFPLMVEMEREHGSLLRAMIARRRKGLGAPTLRSFEGGMKTLIDRLAEELGDGVRTRAGAVAVDRDRDGWRVTLADGTAVGADELVLATSSSRAASILRTFDGPLAAALSEIPAATVAVTAFAFRPSDIPRPLDGYGYLVAREEGLATLGVLWESSLFRGRAPEGLALLRVMMGGARAPHAAALDADAAAGLALAELRKVMGIAAEPVRTWRFPQRGAIAQYTLGHVERVATIRALAARHPGLSLCGTSYDGVSFGAGIASASALAETLAPVTMEAGVG